MQSYVCMYLCTYVPECLPWVVLNKYGVLCTYIHTCMYMYIDYNLILFLHYSVIRLLRVLHGRATKVHAAWSTLMLIYTCICHAQIHNYLYSTHYISYIHTTKVCL